jgi:acetate kinase
MRILVFNAGSSSLKFGLFDMDDAERQLLKATYDRFDGTSCHRRVEAGESRIDDTISLGSIEAAIGSVPGLLGEFDMGSPELVGHRIAHGGDAFAGPALVDDATIAAIEALVPLAPLHNPAGLAGIAAARETWPDLRQVAVFDTSFHLANPPRATTYAVPKAWRDAGLRRFGFHGTSHKYVAERAAAEMGRPLRDLRLVSLHLGNGASACAVALGSSIDSSMGLTPLEGLVMGTRSGDVDPGVFGFLARRFGLSIEEIETALYEESGLKGLTGSSDMRDVEARAAEGDADAQLAIELYAYRARRYIGAYAAAMGGLDAIVFTGGIGENSASMRRRICDGLEFLGLQLDHERNAAVDLAGHAAPQIQAYGSRIQVLVTETAEQLMIAREAARLVDRPAPAAVKIPVAVSARHVHLDQASVSMLFGKGYELKPAADLRQPGHWVAAERVALQGPKGTIENVAILAPLRSRVQIEISRTDGFALGVEPPVRDSGKLDGTPRIRIVGPAGSLETDGLIIAARHIHTNPADAKALGLEDGEEVDVRIGEGERALTFAGTLVRVGADAFTEMHIDTDEANAAGLGRYGEGEVVAEAAEIGHRA